MSTTPELILRRFLELYQRVFKLIVGTIKAAILQARIEFAGKNFLDIKRTQYIFNPSRTQVKSENPRDQHWQTYNLEIGEEFKKLKKNFLSERRAINSSTSVYIYRNGFFRSPGGASHFLNMSDGFDHLGVEASFYESAPDLSQKLDSGRRRSIVLASGSPDQIRIVKSIRRRGVLIGITAPSEADGSCGPEEFLSLLGHFRPDFFYCFKNQDFIRRSKYFHYYKSLGYPVLSMRFGFNPRSYSRNENIRLPLFDYTFLASHNRAKIERVYAWIYPLIKENSNGLINGPGWISLGPPIPRDHHGTIYTATKVGLNIHLPDNQVYADEINERAYILNGLGVPQVSDSPLAWSREYPTELSSLANSPHEFRRNLNGILSNPLAVLARSKKLMHITFESHLVSSRAQDFLEQVKSNGL